MPNIYSYINYRTYLKDWFEEKKLANPKFSYRVMARLAGFSSPNFLKLVMMGQRNLSKEGIGKVSEALHLKVKDDKFFETLVQFNQCHTREEKEQFYNQLCLFKAFSRIQKLETDGYEYLSNWYHVAIRELVALSNFKEDPAWISKRLNKLVSEKEVKKSLELLVDLGLVERADNGRLKQTSKNLATEPEVFDLSIANFHDNMIALAADSIDADPSTRDISSVTVAMDQKTYLEARRRVQDFRKELNVLLSNCKSPDAVYQINFQIFGLTEVPWHKK